MNVFPDIPVFPVYNRIADTFPLHCTVLKQPPILIVVIIQDDFLIWISCEILKYSAIVLTFCTFRPTNPGCYKPIPTVVLLKYLMESFP